MENVPPGNYLILLHGGRFPVVKKYRIDRKEEIAGGRAKTLYYVRGQYFVRIGAACHPLKGKRSLLKLFPQYKNELNAYARQARLDFGKRREASLVALLTYAEEISQ
jgi:hypothetical protein